MSDSSSFIRPFIITSGRTEARRTNLHLDTMVSSLVGRTGQDRGFEHRAVLRLCAEPISIAELAVTLDLPVGVVTVVVDDLLDDNVLFIHQSRSATVSLSLLERLVEGVRAL